MKLHFSKQSGFTIPQVLFTAVFLVSLGIIMASSAVINMQFATRTQKSASAAMIAEAGVNYYLWHLSHNNEDYCDGATCGTLGPDGYGPFTYDYKDDGGKKIGTYSIYVQPPSQTTTTTTIKSIGKYNGQTSSRTIQAQIAIPSFAQYSILTNTEIWIGQNESVNGPLHSNIGVHFDGTTNDSVTAAQATYRPTAQFGGNGQIKNGVWGIGGPQSFWRFPVPPVDFNSVTADLQKLKADAQSGGRYLNPTNPGNPSSKLGYYLELRADNSIDVYRVTQDRCGSISRNFSQNIPRPANGILFVEDNVWIRNYSNDKYNNRLTIAAAYLPENASTNKTITITGNILYNVKDGSNAIGLIAQKDVKVSRLAPNTLEINAAMLAQKGHVWYQKDTLAGTNCSQSVKTTITVYGAIATNQYWTWTYVTGSAPNYTTVDGYNTTVNTYDQKLKFNPPPSFPLAGSFSILNYREILTNP